jgi:ketosteroid isomerase-like protein
MKNSPKTVVDKMFAAFATGDIDAILETVSENSVWIYHGTQVIPKGEYRGKDGARKFFSNILNGTEIIKFEAE